MDSKKQLAQIRHELQQGGFKITPQREATIEIILDNAKAHLSAEQVFMQTKAVAPEIGLATVYRTLEILTELNILSKISFTEDGITHYDLREAPSEKHFHHHLLCVQCGQIQEIHTDLLLDVEKKVTADFDFVVLDHRLTFHGICQACQQANLKRGLPADQVDPSKKINLSQL